MFIHLGNKNLKWIFVPWEKKKTNFLSFCMIKQMIRVSSQTRPFGILSNGVLPLRDKNEYYPSVEHFMMSSMLGKQNDKNRVLSYPDLQEAKIVYNQLDEAQYIGLLEKCCMDFYQKKTRNTSKFGNTSLGVALRNHLRQNAEYVYRPKEDTPMSSVLGILNQHGYNVLGNALKNLHHTLLPHDRDIPAGMESLFWRMEGRTTATSPKEFRFIHKGEEFTHDQKLDRALAQTLAANLMKKHTPLQDAEDDELLEEVFDEDADDAPKPSGELADLLLDESVPKKPPTYRQRRNRPDRLYFYEGGLSPVEEDALEKQTDPMQVFRIYKVAEFLSWLMDNGSDILSFWGKPIDTIFIEHRLCPELMGNSIPPHIRRLIYKDYWDAFRNQTIPFFDLIKNEILYPNNIVGFIRKQKISQLNPNIGSKIQKILFASFLEQVVRKHYPQVQGSFIPMAVYRESGKFSMEEYQQITNHLYHLFFQDKFKVSPEDEFKIRFFEAQRRTLDQIQEALRFVPSHVIRPETVDVQTDPLLDPMSAGGIKTDGRTFEDLFQYIYFHLFQYYGDLKPEQAYAELKENGKLVNGDNPLLGERLNFLVQTRRRRLLEDALTLKFNTYPQVQEMLLYLLCTKQSLQFEEPMDSDTGAFWLKIAGKHINPHDEQLMSFVLSYTKKDFEKSIFLYSFLREFLRNLHLFKTLSGKRLSGSSLQGFFNCFYKNLLVLHKHHKKSTPCPDEFKQVLEHTKSVQPKDTEFVWERVFSYIAHFTKQDFRPSALFNEAREEFMQVEKDQKMARLIRSFVKMIHCLYPRDSDITSPELYVLVQIFTGKDDILPWKGTSEIMEMEDDPNLPPPLFHLLPPEIQKKIKLGKKGKVEKRQFRHDLVHPVARPLLPLLTSELGWDNHRVLSPLSFALASILQNLTNTRRIQFFLA